MSAIVFDLDGTLVDSAPDIHAAVNRMLADTGHAPLDLATVTDFIGNGIPQLVRLVMQARGIEDHHHDEMLARMLDHYTARPAELTRPYPGVVKALTALCDAHYRLGVCTNKFTAPSQQILGALGIAGFFDVVVGGDSLAVKKPDPAPLDMAFGALGGPPLLYVGDSEVDAKTAQAAGLRFALFTEGYRKSPMADLPHDYAFSHHDALPALVSGLRGAA